MEAMSRREKILKWMLVLSALLSAALLPMQGQKQGSDYMLHGGDGGIQPYKYNGKELDRMHGRADVQRLPVHDSGPVVGALLQHQPLCLLPEQPGAPCGP